MVVSGRKQQKVNWAAAALQREGLGMTGPVCHMGKGEDREGLAATVRGSQGGGDGATGILLLITSPRKGSIPFPSAPAQGVCSLPHRSRQEEEMLVCKRRCACLILASILAVCTVLSTREAHSTLGV